MIGGALHMIGDAFAASYAAARAKFLAAASERALVQRGDARGVIAAVFEPLERIDQVFGDRFGPEYSDDPAHPIGCPLKVPL